MAVAAHITISGDPREGNDDHRNHYER
jgi:hypothetical protein